VADAVRWARSSGSVTYDGWKGGDQRADRRGDVAESSGETRAVRWRGGGSGHDRFERKSVKNLPCERIHHEAVGGQKINTEDGLGDRGQDESAKECPEAERQRFLDSTPGGDGFTVSPCEGSTGGGCSGPMRENRDGGACIYEKTLFRDGVLEID